MTRLFFLLLAIIATTINVAAYTVTDTDGLVYWLDSYYGSEATLIRCNNKDIKSITVPSMIHFGRDVPVKHIGTKANGASFSNYPNLEEIVLPDGILSIQEGSFSRCPALKTFTVPKETKAISIDCFKGCTALKEFIVNKDNNYYSAADGVLMNKEGTKIWKYPLGKEANRYIIPEGVTEIAGYAFSYGYYNGTPRHCKVAERNSISIYYQ